MPEADSLLLVKEGNLSLRADKLHILAGGKNIGRFDIKELTLPWPERSTGGPEVLRPSPHWLLQRYLACVMEELRSGNFAVRLVKNTRGWQASQVEAWLGSCLTVTKQEPPPGVLWTMHSLRSGAAGACEVAGQGGALHRRAHPTVERSAAFVRPPTAVGAVRAPAVPQLKSSQGLVSVLILTTQRPQ